MSERVTRTDTEDPYAAAGIPDSLPVDTNGTDGAFLSLGFEFGEPYSDDPLFRPATIPDGWSLESSGHVMYSYIVDENGDRRAEIFYKAAYYDRRASMRLLPADPKGKEW